MLTYPITRTQIMLGKIAFNVVLALIGSALVIAVAAVMGVPVRWELLPLQLAIIILATCAWFFMFSMFANALERMDAFNTVSSAAYILLMFFSSMLYPLDAVPVWFRVVSWANPMTWQVDLLRFGMLGVGHRTPLLLEAAGLLVFSAACLVFAVRGLQREI
jgi:ABC-2 type transport system permease protein